MPVSSELLDKANRCLAHDLGILSAHSSIKRLRPSTQPALNLLTSLVTSGRHWHSQCHPVERPSARSHLAPRDEARSEVTAPKSIRSNSHAQIAMQIFSAPNSTSCNANSRLSKFGLRCTPSVRWSVFPRFALHLAERDGYTFGTAVCRPIEWYVNPTDVICAGS